MEEATGCPNGCKNFEVTMEDVINAGNKQRDAAIALKDIVNSQKKKLKDYRDRAAQNGERWEHRSQEILRIIRLWQEILELGREAQEI